MGIVRHSLGRPAAVLWVVAAATVFARAPSDDPVAVQKVTVAAPVFGVAWRDPDVLLTGDGEGAVRGWGIADVTSPAVPRDLALPHAAGTPVLAVAVNPADTRLFASGGRDGRVRLGEMGYRQGPTLNTPGAPLSITSIAADPATGVLAAIWGGKQIGRWAPQSTDPQTLTELSRPTGGDDLTSAAWGPRPNGSGRRLVAGSKDGSLEFWDDLAAASRRIATGARGPILGLAVPDAQRVVMVDADGIARTWKLFAGQQDPQALPAGSGKFAVSGDGAWLATAEGSVIRVQHAASEEVKSTRDVGQTVDRLALSWDGTKLAYTYRSEGDKTSLYSWDVGTVPPERVTEADLSDPVTTLAIDNSGGRVSIAAGHNIPPNQVKVRLFKGNTVTEVNSAALNGLSGVAALAFDRAGEALLLVGETTQSSQPQPAVTERNIRRINTADGSRNDNADEFDAGQGQQIRSLCLSADADPFLIVGTETGGVFAWRWSKPKERLVVTDKEQAAVGAVGVGGGEAGRFVVAADAGQIRSWQLDGTQPFELQPLEHPNPLGHTQLWPSRLAVSAAAGEPKVLFAWPAGQAGGRLRRWAPAPIRGGPLPRPIQTAFDRTGTRAAIISAGGATVLDVSSATPPVRLNVSGTVRAAVPLSDGRAVTAMADGSVRLFGRAGAEVAQLAASVAQGTQLALSPDGADVIMGLTNGTVQSVSLSGTVGFPVGAVGGTPVAGVATLPGRDGGPYWLVSLVGGRPQAWEPPPRQGVELDRATAAAYVVAWNAAGNALLAGRGDGTIGIWERKTDMLEWKKIGNGSLKSGESVFAGTFLTSTATDPIRFVTGGGDGQVRFWEKADDKYKLVATAPGHTRAIFSAAVQPATGGAVQGLLATASADMTVRLWNAADRTPFGMPILHPDAVAGVAFSPDGQRLATIDFNRTVRIWQVNSTGTEASPKAVLVLGSPPLSAYGLVWSPKGIFVPAGSGVFFVRPPP